MARRTSSPFPSVRTEGGLLPAETLQRIASGDERALANLSPASYHLPPGERLNEAISRSWSRLVAAWASFRAAREKLPESDAGTTLTRERWLLPLFAELGYGRLPTTKPIPAGGRDYAVSHLWQKTPVHLVSFRVDLDRKTPGAVGASRSSPHSLVQELLNRSDDLLWGIASNGLVLRLLRDNASLSRQAYVEFDLAAMMDGELYSDFTLLWLLLHVSRVEAEKPESSVLEAWTKAAREEGLRALDTLRDGVEKALEVLGRGFLEEPANRALRERLAAGTLGAQDYYRQLLRLVYRLLFLLVAEDRDLLFAPGTSPLARERYRYLRYYGLSRLRSLAASRRGSRHGDLWAGLSLVMNVLGSDDGCPDLALPALGGFLFSEEAMPDLASASLGNASLLEAVRKVALTLRDGWLRPVDFRNLGAEELGSVYESLLELHPAIHEEGRGSFELRSAAGSERKTTGSYYTPTSLIECLLDSALDPVLDEAAKAADPEKALLALKVCDPACGSGHFLIAAAHRLARRLASVRTGEDEPDPSATRTALRDVIGHCLYGVDLNPMAAELCRVALWIESLEPGKPLSFLDHHIRSGDALVGATPSLVAGGIPDSAFDAAEGDDPDACGSLRSRNRAEREGVGGLFAELERDEARALGEAAGLMESAPDDSVLGVRAKEAKFREFLGSPEYSRQKALGDLWTSAFFLAKDERTKVPTTETLRERARDGRLSGHLLTNARFAARGLAFFHWHVAFPEVFQDKGGFDLVLGNPPWDTLSPDTKEFFSSWKPEIRAADPERQKEIVGSLLAMPEIALSWENHCRRLYAQAHFFKKSGRFLLFAPGNLGKGDFNIYRMFVELALQLARPGGYAAQVVPENLYNGANAAALRKTLFEECDLACLYGFENTKEVWFKGIDSRAKFCIYAARKQGRTETFRTAFLVRSPERLNDVLSGDFLEVPVSLIPEFAPESLAIMEFTSQLEIDIARKMYSRWPKFGDATAGEPYRHYMREVDMGNDRGLFTEDPTGVPVYEGRMVSQFDHRAKAYRSGRGRAADWEELPWGRKSIAPQWYIPSDQIPTKVRDRIARYRIGFCDVASPTNERTLVAALIPPEAVCGHKVPTISFDPAFDWALFAWLAVANSFVVDFLVRKKVSLTMSLTVLDSLPMPRFQPEDSVARRLVRLAARLSCTGVEMDAMKRRLVEGNWLSASDLNCEQPAEAARDELRAVLDAIVARDVYGLTRAELEFVLDSFPTVRKYDIARSGEFRTKHRILEIYDELQRASDSGGPFVSRLNPPPGNPRAAHGVA